MTLFDEWWQQTRPDLDPASWGYSATKLARQAWNAMAEAGAKEIEETIGCACQRTGRPGCERCQGTGQIGCNDSRCGDAFWDHACTAEDDCPVCGEVQMADRDHSPACPRAVAAKLREMAR